MRTCVYMSAMCMCVYSALCKLNYELNLAVVVPIGSAGCWVCCLELCVNNRGSKCELVELVNSDKAVLCLLRCCTGNGPRVGKLG